MGNLKRSLEKVKNQAVDDMEKDCGECFKSEAGKEIMERFKQLSVSLGKEFEGKKAKVVGMCSTILLDAGLWIERPDKKKKLLTSVIDLHNFDKRPIEVNRGWDDKGSFVRITGIPETKNLKTGSVYLDYF